MSETAFTSSAAALKKMLLWLSIAEHYLPFKNKKHGQFTVDASTSWVTCLVSEEEVLHGNSVVWGLVYIKNFPFLNVCEER